MIRSQWNKPEQKLNIGFVRWDCGLVEDIEECKIAEPALNEQIQHVRAHPPPKGGIKVVLRMPPENWDVPPDSFFQNNFFLLPKLVETVREFLSAGGARHLVDLYCGVGFFGIELADAVESFVGVEYDQRAIQSARRNAAARKISNGEFVAAEGRGGFAGIAGNGFRRKRRRLCSIRRARVVCRRRCNCCARRGRRKSFMFRAIRRRWRGT